MKAYIRKKYGQERTANIITFGVFKPKAALKAAARIVGIPFQEANENTKYIPLAVETVEEACLIEPLRTAIRNDERYQQVQRVAEQIGGLYSTTGQHAAGIVITKDPLSSVPFFKNREDQEFGIQLAQASAEELGIIKFDILGLKNLTLIRDIINISGYDENLDGMVFDDPNVFNIFSTGDTQGVFQFESKGMKRLLRRLKPDCFEDIVAAVALYRPGPLEGGMVNDFIDRKHGKKTVRYIHPLMKTALHNTYGVIVYQEQVMQIARDMAGFTLGQADNLRRAMGKKKPEEMKLQKEKFLSGCKNKGINDKIALQVFNLVDKFAGYGFNRSHSVAYAMIAYQTAYFKAYYRAQFVVSYINVFQDDERKIEAAIKQNRDLLLPIDVLKSGEKTTIDGFMIRLGYDSIKSTGKRAVAKMTAYNMDKLKDEWQLFEDVQIDEKTYKAIKEADGWENYLIKFGITYLTLDAICDRLKLKNKRDSYFKNPQKWRDKINEEHSRDSDSSA